MSVQKAVLISYYCKGYLSLKGHEMITVLLTKKKTTQLCFSYSGRYKGRVGYNERSYIWLEPPLSFNILYIKEFKLHLYPFIAPKLVSFINCIRHTCSSIEMKQNRHPSVIVLKMHTYTVKQSVSREFYFRIEK